MLKDAIKRIDISKECVELQTMNSWKTIHKIIATKENGSKLNLKYVYFRFDGKYKGDVINDINNIQEFSDKLINIINDMHINHIKYSISSACEPIYCLEVQSRRPSNYYRYIQINDSLYVMISLISFYNRINKVDKLVIPWYINRIYLDNLLILPGSLDMIVINELVVPDGISLESGLDYLVWDSAPIVIKKITNLENISKLQIYSTYKWIPNNLRFNQIRRFSILGLDNVESIYFGDGCKFGLLDITSCSNLKYIRMPDSILNSNGDSIKNSVVLMNNGVNKIVAAGGSPLIGKQIEDNQGVFITIENENN